MNEAVYIKILDKIWSLEPEAFRRLIYHLDSRQGLYEYEKVGS